MATSWKGAPKDPEDTRDYAVDFTADIDDLTIVAAEWTVPVGDVVVQASGYTDKTTTGRLTGGTVAMSPAQINVHVVLSDGQELDVTNTLVIKERVTK